MALRTGLWPRVLWLSLFGVLVPQVVGTTEAQVFSPSPPPPAAFPKGPPLASPLSLTASDGSGLQLVSMTARAVIEDPLAFTELHLVFHNAEPRQREGRFRITLPPGATVSRFAMKIGDRLMEGEVVERQAARRAYEDFLHRRQDPALMENEAGNEFSARIFPIPPNSDKELIVAYSQELTQSKDPFRLPLRGLPKLAELDIRVLVGSAERQSGAGSNLGGAVMRQEIVEINKQNYQPDRDLEVTRRGAAARMGLRHDNLIVARVRPVTDKAAADPIRSLLVLVDTSASRALGFEAQLAQLTRVLAGAASASDFDLQVMAFDQDSEPVYRGRASGWGADDVRRLLERRPEGASNLQLALTRVAERYRGQSLFDRMLIVSDGVVTAGSERGDELKAQVAKLAALGIQRTDVLAVGGIRDDARLGMLVRAGLARDGMVLAEGMEPGEAGQRLLLATRSGIKVAVPGARWIWPEKLDGMQPGDEVLVYADLPGDARFSIALDGKPAGDVNAPLVSVERPLLERAWVKARIARLSQQRDTVAAGDADVRAALEKQIVELSTRFRVLCDTTALLVLESELDYARFNIDRRALADILTVGASGLEVVNRSGASPLLAAGLAQPEPADEPAAALERDRTDTRERRASASPPAGAPARREEAEKADRPRSAAASVAAASSPRMMPQGAAPQPSSVAALDDDELSSLEGGLAVRRSAPAAPASRARAIEAASDELAAPARTAHAQRSVRVAASPESESGPVAMTGELAEIDTLLRQGHKQDAFDRALAWRKREPGDVLGIVALGRALEALGKKAEAARVYGSIIDLFPSRADLRRFAAGYLERLQIAGATALALDCLRHAVADRPDHPSSHHLLAMALLQNGQPSEAFAALESALKIDYPSGRFSGVDRVLREDLGLAGAAWARKDPEKRGEIERRIHAAGGVQENRASLRFVLSWETDANDVDFHIHDSHGGHAFYSSPHLPSGGDLYADVTTGYGPECFTIREPQKHDAGPYRLQAHYYSKGPMGYGMGRLEIIDHDGQGKLRFESRPFVVMNDGAFLDLGSYSAAKPRVVAAAGGTVAEKL
jgi:tetratricopeptide (TPR) repeat protein